MQKIATTYPDYTLQKALNLTIFSSFNYAIQEKSVIHVNNYAYLNTLHYLALTAKNTLLHTPNYKAPLHILRLTKFPSTYSAK